MIDTTKINTIKLKGTSMFDSEADLSDCNRCRIGKYQAWVFDVTNLR
jgi:hypothetical protein